jgi:hypothetical protein
MLERIVPSARWGVPAARHRTRQPGHRGENMPTVSVDAGLLQDLLSRRDELVRTIAAGMTSGEWDPVMRAFDGLLSTIARLEDSLGRSDGA